MEFRLLKQLETKNVPILSLHWGVDLITSSPSGQLLISSPWLLLMDILRVRGIQTCRRSSTRVSTVKPSMLQMSSPLKGAREKHLETLKLPQGFCNYSEFQENVNAKFDAIFWVWQKRLLEIVTIGHHRISFSWAAAPLPVRCCHVVTISQMRKANKATFWSSEQVFQHEVGNWGKKLWSLNKMVHGCFWNLWFLYEVTKTIWWYILLVFLILAGFCFCFFPPFLFPFLDCFLFHCYFPIHFCLLFCICCCLI